MVKYTVPWPKKNVKITNPKAPMTPRERKTAVGVSKLVKRFIKVK